MKNIKFQHNYHTHTIYCRHAKNTVEENIKYAIKVGLKTLGFSEHAPLNVHRNFRLNLDEVDDYVNEVNFYKNKYKKQIKVFVGFEAEYHRDEYKFYKNLRNKVDYMILGNHNLGNPHQAKDLKTLNSFDLEQYGEQLEDACKSKLFIAIAHPDYVYDFYHSWDEDAIRLANHIIDCSLKYNIPLGFNINGLLCKKTKMNYPNDYFWELVSHTKCKVIIEADAHQISTMSLANSKKAIELIKKWNLQNNVISKLNIKTK